MNESGRSEYHVSQQSLGPKKTTLIWATLLQTKTIIWYNSPAVYFINKVAISTLIGQSYISVLFHIDAVHRQAIYYRIKQQNSI